jgi:hypothetical protein
MSDVMKDIFEGFPYAFGTDEGGCRWAPVTSETYKRHLEGSEMIGIYPMVYDPHKEHVGSAGFINANGRPVYSEMKEELWKCKWGAVDIDEGDDSIVYAQNVATVLEALDITSWVELSRSKGCHVWIFTEEWVQAHVIRKALLAAVQISAVKFDAVYPKQDSIEGPPGNYMRLPYGGNRPNGRQVMLDRNNDSIDLYDFILDAETNRVPTQSLIDVSKLWKAPVQSLPPERSYDKKPLMQIDGTRLRGVARRMWEDGPHSYFHQSGAGKGRHGFLDRFARAMWEAGYSEPDVVAWTSKLDAQLGAWWPEGPKFEGRRDAQRQIEHLVQHARTIATRH